MKIVLLGYMGSGKTVVAKQLWQRPCTTLLLTWTLAIARRSKTSP